MKYIYADNLKQVIIQLDEMKKRQIYDAIDKYIEDYQMLKSESGGPMAALTYMIKVQESIDKLLSSSNAPKIACKKGCSFCCHMQVHITEDEAMLLAVSVKRKKISYDKKRLKKQSLYSEGQWKNKTFKEKRCVFLNQDNHCVAYEYRPINCRKLLASSPREYCDPLYDGMIEQYVELEVKIIATAVKSCCVLGILPNIFRDKLSSL